VSSLTAEEVRAMLVHVARRMEESESLLTDADRATGDGDHGIGMSRGFAAVRRELANGSGGTVAELLDTTGRTLLTSVGGASGILFATFFRGGAAAVGDRETFDAEALRLFLAEGTEAVRQRGKASPGDKTMLDALLPAAEAAANEDSPAALLAAASAAARRGVEETKGMVARTGKARPLGARSLGYPDPGALSASLIVDAMAEFVSGRDQDAVP
jgi:phosphoenolpyruvate---glycerone phosphotransferase subunit DhaL